MTSYSEDIIFVKQVECKGGRGMSRREERERDKRTRKKKMGVCAWRGEGGGGVCVSCVIKKTHKVGRQGTTPVG